MAPSSTKSADIINVESSPTESQISPSSDLKVEVEHEEQHESSSDKHIDLVHHDLKELEKSGLWYHKRIIPGIPPYSNSFVQIIVMSFVIFLTPGCFNAITGIGNSGISDPKVADNANVALYSCFATIGAFSGVICNYIGVKACLMFGGTGYFMYTASLLVFHQTGNKGFPVFAGAYLGVCAALTWAAQGSIVMSYALEHKKATAIMVYWVIFNCGAVIGSIIPLAQNMTTGDSHVNAGTYVAFMILMAGGVVLAGFMLPMDKVYKSDGTKVIAKKYPKITHEIKGMWKVLKTEGKIYFMFPMFCASNWFYTYQFNNFNAARFNVRTRSLNGLLYWLTQMVGAIVIGFLLDWKRFKRPMRAKLGWIVIFLFGMATWGGGLKFQLGVTRENVDDDPLIDFHDSNYIGPMFLYMCYGGFDAIFQSYIFWVLGTFSNNPKKVALYASFYKSLQSAFNAIVWRLDAQKTPFMHMFASSWALVVVSMLIAAPMIFFKITEHTNAEDDDIDDMMDDEEITTVRDNEEAKDAKEA
ncbi:hypothetical protein FT663_04720 [Candidozyma haemuli var. vulneris]|uniref:Uncharacterized protein n=1 Tax=Candidozyma haemuli TaxID=45357 RepID=A0A2V1ARR9_9ASCO|nr:hypothetical protein CXQ85_002222 [[Candida] haemuloni]KAF3986003.1 hypothetical protein FT662_04825 [[Candida] haemuloni var. vulneris]KAF3986813.1 hypothetical protein FT663_04720 [[Candida] haemuloni var. vulneris]PVH20434.1 hypothetical protein CXQ85_002222 [[Candida] haemuloni]